MSIDSSIHYMDHGKWEPNKVINDAEEQLTMTQDEAEETVRETYKCTLDWVKMMAYAEILQDIEGLVAHDLFTEEEFLRKVYYRMENISKRLQWK